MEVRLDAIRNFAGSDLFVVVRYPVSMMNLVGRPDCGHVGQVLHFDLDSRIVAGFEQGNVDDKITLVGAERGRGAHLGGLDSRECDTEGKCNHGGNFHARIP